VVKLLPDKNNAFLNNASSFGKKCVVFCQKIEKNIKKGLFLSFSDGFPVAN
jgi:hypothetical protein